MSSDRFKLADELERAEGPSRELDARIEALFTDERGTRPLAFFRHQIESGHKRPPRFTISVDAAMLLVPRGRKVTIQTFGGPGPRASVEPNERFCSGATPALALCAAALRAEGE